jgi:hypothetical protein
MGESLRIERANDPAAVEALRQLLLESGSLQVTAAQAAWQWKRPVDECRAALFELCAQHPSRLERTADGSLRFCFEGLQKGRPSQKRPIRWRDHVLAISTVLFGPPLMLMLFLQTIALLEQAAKWPALLAVATFLFSVPVVVVLVFAGVLGFFYFQMFPGVGLFLLFLGVFMPFTPFMEKSPESLTGKLALSGFLLVIGTIFGILPGWLLLRGLKRQYQEMFIESSTARKLWDDLAGLLRGPAPSSPWEEALRSQALIAERGGTFHEADLAELHDCSPERAADEAARIVVESEGELLLDEGTPIGYRVTAKRPSQESDTRPARVRSAARPRLFGCSNTFAWLTLAVLTPTLLSLVVNPQLRLFPHPSEFFGHDGAQGFGLWPFLPFLIGVPLRVLRWSFQRAR